LCEKHNSTTCGCKLGMTKEEIEIQINKSIDYYKICSIIFQKINGKIVFINTNHKIQFLNNANYEFS